MRQWDSPTFGHDPVGQSNLRHGPNATIQIQVTYSNILCLGLGNGVNCFELSIVNMI